MDTLSKFLNNWRQKMTTLSNLNKALPVYYIFDIQYLHL